MSYNITDYFVKIIQQSGSIDIARAEFKRLISEDEELDRLYRLWCEETGHSFRNGFDNFCEEYMDSQQSVWDMFDDFDE